jgi:hypothetical protein
MDWQAYGLEKHSLREAFSQAEREVADWNELQSF